ncbi:hypothetical protein SAMN02910344_01134 [Ruminobacter amylophilus]|uniref:Uncharacterized protein n=1 Tax=Ruminobacter amylophilus TaxID=867 RepID=A0A662ZIF5_9GAMM|nr:hypothetical protein [Ruminobacter amylophilus]SFP33802.1 hypothetical protein SAMN02910344_01134 [Ruminobacter amylophilus]
MNFKTLLKESSNIIHCNNVDYIDNIKIGNNDFIFDETILKSFFIYNNTTKLYVFLSAVGIQRDIYPLFHRISWHDRFDGMKIFFDDPTRDIIKFSPSFYFGNPEKNCLSYIKNIIEKLKEHYNLNNEDITFISSSNGGFGCIYLSNELHGAKCIALCPQLDVKLFLDESRFNIFKEKTEIFNNDALPDIKDRLNLYRISKNNSTKFVIFSNIACNSDKKQMDAFCEYINYSYKLGLNKLSENFYLIIVSMDNIDPHNVQPDVNFCSYLSKYFWEDCEERRISSVNYFIDMMNQTNDLDFKNKVICSILACTPETSKIILKRREDGVVDIFFNEKVYLRVNNFKNKVRPSIRISKTTKSLDMSKIYTYVKNSNSYIDENHNWVNIFKDPIPVDEYHVWFQDITSNLGIFQNGN